jgi:hypothetical protein
MGSPGASFWGRGGKFLCTSPLFVQAEGRSNQLVTLFSASPNYATYKQLISFKFEIGCKKDHFYNKILTLAMTH